MSSISTPTPPNRLEKIAAWAYQNNVATLHGPIRSLDGRGMERKAEWARDIWKQYCSANGIEYIYKPSNIAAVFDALMLKMGYESAEEARGDNEKLCTRIESLVVTYRWSGDYLCNQEIDVQYVANTIFKSEDFRTRILTDDVKAAIAARERAKTAIRPRDDGTLTQEIEAFLKEHWKHDYTYGQIAKELRADGRQVGRLVRRLADKETSGVVMWIHKYEDAKTKAKKRTELYKWSPQRKQIDRQPSRTDEVVQMLLLHFLSRKPGASWVATRSAMREALGHVSNDVVDRNLQALIAADKIERRKGFKGAQEHYLK